MQRPTDLTLWLCHDVYSCLADEATRRAPYETGGVLLGYWSEHNDAPVVTSFLGPGPKAVHEHHRFVPDQQFHLQGIAQRYRDSGRRLTYLGDWHTHPGHEAYLSRTDLHTLRKVAAEPKSRAPRPVMLILAPGPEWKPTAWQAELPRGKLFPRKMITHHLTVIVYKAASLQV